MASRDTTKLAMYGDYEVGKTMQIKHLIHAYGAEKVIILNADAGLSSINSHLEGVEVVRVGSRDDMRRAYCDIFGSDIYPDGSPCAKKYVQFNEPGCWIVQDGVSRIFEWIENDNKRLAEAVYVAVLAEKKVDPLLAKYRTCVTESDRYDQQKVYGFIGRDIEDYCSAWIKSAANTYWTFMEALTGHNGRNRCKPLGPSIPGRMGLDSVMRSMDFIFRMYWEGERCFVRTRATDEFLARRRNDIDAGDAIPDVIENFNVAEFAMAHGAQPKETANVVGPEVR